MKNYLRFLSPVMLLLMAVMFGGGKIYAKDVTVTQTLFYATSANNICGDKNVFYSTAKGGGTLAPKVNNNEIQLYQNTKGKGGGTITIKSIDGVVIKSVTIGSSMKTSVAYTIDNSTTKSANSSLNKNGKYTVPNLTASSITFYCMGKNADSRLYVNYLSVTYSIEGSDKTETTLSFKESGNTFTYDLDSNNNVGILENPATLSPAVEGAVISYTITQSTFADNSIEVDQSGTVIFPTDKEASATITASYAGNDTYEASTASYTIKVVNSNALVFSDDYKSFNEILTTGYKPAATPRDYSLLANNGNNYTFNLQYSYRNDNGIQMQKSSAGAGVVISPKFGFSYGYTVTIEYTSGNGITLSAGDKTVTGTAGSSISLTTTSDIPFTIKTGSQYAVVKTIRVVANNATETETLTTSAGGYATYSADYAVNYSELGLTAYTLTVDETNKTVTAKAFTGVVPAGKAVLVKGTASKAYTLTPATTEGDATFATDLQTGATTADGTQYGFTSKSGTPAFAQVQSGQEIPAKKGYIVLNGASAAKYSICFDDEATGIQTIEAASAANGAMYNLAGQRVDKAYKGIVIVNGKKYLNK